MKHVVRLALFALATVVLGACSTTPAPANLGPMKYDASGLMPCSAGAPTYNAVCGWRVLRKPGGAAEIWIANIAAPKDTISYRVLNFARGEFTTPDGIRLEVSRSGDFWLVSVPGREYYRLANALISGS